jgi:hypothetical protein
MVFCDVMWIRFSFGDFARHFDAVMPAIVFEIYDVVATSAVYTVNKYAANGNSNNNQNKTDIHFIKFNFFK